MKIQDLAQKAFPANKAKGFWDEDRNIQEALALINSEISEGLEALRKGKRADLSKVFDNEETFVESFRQNGKDTLEDELADALIRMADFYGGMGFTEFKAASPEQEAGLKEVNKQYFEHIQSIKNTSKSLFLIQKFITNLDDEIAKILADSEEFSKVFDKAMEETAENGGPTASRLEEILEKYEVCSYFFGKDIKCPINLEFAFNLLYSLAKDKLGIDIDKHIELKMRYNATREYKHGKKF